MSLYDKLLELENLKTDTDSGVARKRGLDFERLIREIFHKQGLLSIIKPSGYHTSDNRSEQIDGVVNIEGKVFLLEAKWDENLAASSLYEFIGKIENKFFGTLGIYISFHELKDNFINALRKGRKQNVIVIHGEDVRLLFKEEIDLKEFFKYAYERLCFDNLSHISVKEFIKFTSSIISDKVDLKIDDDKVKEFIKSNITTKVNRDYVDMEVELGKLTEAEKAKVFLILFKHSNKLLTFSFPVPSSYSNARTFFSIYKPDFNVNEINDLPNQYYSKYIFEEPRTYLINFNETFIDEFPKINKTTKEKFENKVVELYKKSDWEIENALTLILEKYENLYSKPVLKEIHKVYIGFYYSSSRERRFPQKTYAISLVRNRKLSEETIWEWIEEKLEYDLKLYDSFKDFNLSYFSKTYLDLGLILNLTENEWNKKIKKIYTQHAV